MRWRNTINYSAVLRVRPPARNLGNNRRAVFRRREGSRVREFKVMELLDPGEFIPGMEARAMSKTRIGVLAVVAGVLSVSVPLFAHHGSSVFDATKTVTMKGSVTEWDWFNPHCLLQFDVMNEGGQVVHWIAETQNPAEMVSLGWGKTSFKPGDEVTVSLMPVKNGNPFGRVSLVVVPDDKTFFTIKQGVSPKYAVGAAGASKSDNSTKQ